jgi:hypothetical protein
VVQAKRGIAYIHSFATGTDLTDDLAKALIAQMGRIEALLADLVPKRGKAKTAAAERMRRHRAKRNGDANSSDVANSDANVTPVASEQLREPIVNSDANTERTEPKIQANEAVMVASISSTKKGSKRASKDLQAANGDANSSTDKPQNVFRQHWEAAFLRVRGIEHYWNEKYAGQAKSIIKICKSVEEACASIDEFERRKGLPGSGFWQNASFEVGTLLAKINDLRPGKQVVQLPVPPKGITAPAVGRDDFIAAKARSEAAQKARGSL